MSSLWFKIWTLTCVVLSLSPLAAIIYVGAHFAAKYW